MNQPNRTVRRRFEGGQTLVVALIVMGLLLILGFTFLGIVNRSIVDASRQQARSEANDLAEAGVRYAHAQLLQSPEGADWRGRPVDLAPAGIDVTRDPDVLYLRPGTGGPMPSNPNVSDRGGPDGLGPYIRINYPNGRALVRVRFAPSDANIFSTSPTGALRNPGAVRNYTIIESVGREGKLNPNDPTTLTSRTPIRFRNYGSQTLWLEALSAMNAAEGQIRSSRKLRAFASIGIVESAWYITDKNRVSRAADIGTPSGLGATLGTTQVGPDLPRLLGSSARLINPANGSTTANPVPGFGSIFSNAPLRLHGRMILGLNATLGDQIDVADSIRPADGQANLTVLRSSVQNGVWDTQTLSVPAANLDSRSNSFNTLGGILRDGEAGTDAQGFARGVGYKAPPSILTRDADSGESRYIRMTRESGAVLAGPGGGAANSGRYGHGRGVYVDNTADRQIGTDETGRINTGSNESLVFDWLNPGNGWANSGWQGPFYIPKGASVVLSSDGFTITRDANAPDSQRFWRNRDGSIPTVQTSSLRYRIGLVSGVPYIVNSLTPGANADSANPNFAAGVPFNGVLFFEGNVRVRGVIATDVQMTLVSMGTIYIEGSITKGVVANHVSDPSGSTVGQRLNRPTRSMLMLMAKDYVAVNTTQFVGPSSTGALETVASTPGVGMSALRMRASGGSLGFVADFPLDPASGNTPDTWTPYAAGYRELGNPTASIPTRLVLTQSMDDGPASGAYYSLNVNPGLTDTATTAPSAFYFPRTATDPTVQRPLSIFAANAMANFNIGGNPASTTIYGLGGEPFQRYANFETVAFPIVNPATLVAADLAAGVMTNTGPEGSFGVVSQGAEYQTDGRRNASLNALDFRPNGAAGAASNDFLVGRAALMPHDVRIEASVFAEEGSFFVIPGPWFNPNPNDTRDAYEGSILSYQSSGLGGSAARLRADLDRIDRFGATPITPFYGEPVSVRVQVIGAVSENMPPAVADQAEWIRKWGWMPKQLAAMYDFTTGQPIQIPASHVPNGFDASSSQFVPNLSISYDPALASARANGFVNNNNPFDPVSPAIRTDDYGRPLPPMPRLPVSPALAYFGEVK